MLNYIGGKVHDIIFSVCRALMWPQRQESASPKTWLLASRGWLDFLLLSTSQPAMMWKRATCMYQHTHTHNM